jgi:hypothetical protein
MELLTETAARSRPHYLPDDWLARWPGATVNDEARSVHFCHGAEGRLPRRARVTVMCLLSERR